jgi:hypothetical protein
MNNGVYIVNKNISTVFYIDMFLYKSGYGYGYEIYIQKAFIMYREKAIDLLLV